MKCAENNLSCAKLRISVEILLNSNSAEFPTSLYRLASDFFNDLLRTSEVWRWTLIPSDVSYMK